VSTHLERGVADRGCYLLLLKLARDRRVRIGRLGRFTFRKGTYVYVGSAQRGLEARLARHLRRRKRFHWHIDYLRAACGRVVGLPIRSFQRQECDVARAMAALLEPGPAGFGSSDCRCPTHLFRSPADPLALPAFRAVLERFRMRSPP